MSNAIFTDAGRALIAGCLANGAKLTITELVLADVPGLNVDIEPDQAAPLPPVSQIVYRAAPQPGLLTPETAVFSTILTADKGDFHINYMGLLAGSTLVAVCVMPRHLKFKSTEFKVGNSLIKNFALEVKNIADLTGITVPAEAWQWDFDDRYAAIAHHHDDRYEKLGAVAAHNTAAAPHAGKFEAKGAVAVHNTAADAHAGKFAAAGHNHDTVYEAKGAVVTHNSDANAHAGKFEAAGAVAAHNTAAAPHAGKFDAAGTATGAVAAHNTAAAPHAGKFDAAGTATGAVAAHNTAADAHAGKFAAAGHNHDTVYEAKGAVAAHNTAAAPHAGKFEAAGAVSAHNSAADAHPDLRGRLDAIADHVVEVWTAADGSAWYRKYSSGWVEQGGTLPAGTTTTLTITFPMQFANADYTILKSFSIHNNGEGGGGSIIYNQAGFYAKTATSARTSMTNLMDAAFWIAFGRAAQQGGSDGGSGGTQ